MAFNFGLHDFWDTLYYNSHSIRNSSANNAISSCNFTLHSIQLISYTDFQGICDINLYYKNYKVHLQYET
jgi:hypothetical protein